MKSFNAYMIDAMREQGRLMQHADGVGVWSFDGVICVQEKGQWVLKPSPEHSTKTIAMANARLAASIRRASEIMQRAAVEDSLAAIREDHSEENLRAEYDGLVGAKEDEKIELRESVYRILRRKIREAAT